MKRIDLQGNIVYTFCFFLLFIISGCKPEPPTPQPPPDPPDLLQLDFITGMDLSYQPLMEALDVPYYDQNADKITDMVDFVQANGVNLVRLRLFHSPDLNDSILGFSNLERVLAYGERIVQSGNKILLDIHYSDTWADPGTQKLPAAWSGLSFQQVNDSVYQYTLRILQAFQQKNALPYMVQIGNETNSGFLWDHGRVWGAFESNWPNYAALIKSGINAVEKIETESGKEIYTMLHVAGVVNQNTFFQRIDQEGVEYDLIGLSHYHLHHTRDLNQLQSALNQLADAYQKPIIIVETNYPWTLDWNDWTHNGVGEQGQLITGYPASPEGQKAYTEKLIEILEAVPDNLGAGFVWWAPDLVAYDGEESTNGSAFENLTVFDFDNRALPVMDVFRDH
ncbi:MAG: glycosyl hydrolase 53 family protein [Bacteroidetes bacterium]|nr:glycosyl hydrolase 53 family protein [Bacteroidota bacterium]